MHDIKLINGKNELTIITRVDDKYKNRFVKFLYWNYFKFMARYRA